MAAGPVNSVIVIIIIVMLASCTYGRNEAARGGSTGPESARSLGVVLSVFKSIFRNVPWENAK